MNTKSVLITMSYMNCFTRMLQSIQPLFAVIAEAHTHNQPMRDTNYCETSESTTDADDIPQNEEVPRMKKQVQTPRQRETSELVTLFKEFTKSKEESEKEKMLKLEQMHSDKMNAMGRFLQVFEKSMNKVDKE